MNTRADWEKIAASLKFHTKAFIDGQYIDAATGETFDTVNPASGTLIARIASCSDADVERAVKAARRAFDSGVWSRMDASQRGRRLQKFADLIDANLQELALLETLDAGKPIGDSLAVDIPLSANAIRWYGQAIDKIYDEVAPTSRNAIATIRREPVGVVAAVVPWNFPLLMAAWKIGPVLAAGNSIILKPAEQSPLTAIRIAELAAEADIPSGVFNVLPDGSSSWHGAQEFLQAIEY
jgi:acyl-CoA reductase-like NAD-dependent aldehyde dehydrogenase